MRFTVEDCLSWEGAKPQFNAVFAEFKHLFFRKNAERAPFGWIRYKADSEKCANSTYWEAKLRRDGGVARS